MTNFRRILPQLPSNEGDWPVQYNRGSFHFAEVI